MYAEFTCVYIHIYMYGRQVYLCECICLHICTPSLQVVYVFACMQTEFICICVYIYIYTHGNYICVGIYFHICTPSTEQGARYSNVLVESCGGVDEDQRSILKYTYAYFVEKTYFFKRSL